MRYFNQTVNWAKFFEVANPGHQVYFWQNGQLKLQNHKLQTETEKLEIEKLKKNTKENTKLLESDLRKTENLEMENWENKFQKTEQSLNKKSSLKTVENLEEENLIVIYEYPWQLGLKMWYIPRLKKIWENEKCEDENFEDYLVQNLTEIAKIAKTKKITFIKFELDFGAENIENSEQKILENAKNDEKKLENIEKKQTKKQTLSFENFGQKSEIKTVEKSKKKIKTQTENEIQNGIEQKTKILQKLAQNLDKTIQRKVQKSSKKLQYLQTLILDLSDLKLPFLAKTENLESKIQKSKIQKSESEKNPAKKIDAFENEKWQNWILENQKNETEKLQKNNLESKANLQKNNLGVVMTGKDNLKNWEILVKTENSGKSFVENQELEKFKVEIQNEKNIAEKDLNFEIGKSKNLGMKKFETRKSEIVNFWEQNDKIWLRIMDKRTRYGTRKAVEFGWQFSFEKSPENFKIFYNLAEKTSLRQGFAIHPKNYLHKLFKQEFIRIIVLFDQKNTAQAAWLGIWQLENKNSVLTNLYGGNSLISRDNYGQYFLHLAAIFLAKMESEQLNLGQNNLENFKENLKIKENSNLSNLENKKFSESLKKLDLGIVESSGLENEGKNYFNQSHENFSILEKMENQKLKSKIVKTVSKNYQNQCFYDLGGLESGKGFDLFKKGYLGEIRNFVGPFDIILEPKKYHLVNQIIKLGKFLQNLKNQIKKKIRGKQREDCSL